MNTVTRLFDILQYQLDNYPLENALVTKHEGRWLKTSTKEYIEKSNAVSRTLLSLGIKKDDKIAIISSKNSTEWHITDMGILQTGAQDVPIYPSISLDDYEYIFNHAEVKYVFVSDKGLYDKITSIKDKLPNVKDYFSFDKIKGVKNIEDFIEEGLKLDNQNEVEQIKSQIKEDDLATLIYTSGTTGSPKGVMLSHKNIISNFKGCQDRIPVGTGDTCLSFLPICHIFERMVVYLYQYNGLPVYFAESIDKMGDNLREVQPQLITVVPRLVEKVYDKIYEKGCNLKGIKRNIFFWAINLGFKYSLNNNWWYKLQLSIARKFVFNKWHEALGGNLKVLVSGSASLQPRLIRIFCAAGLPIMEGYGLTETSPVIAVNTKEESFKKIGTVGRPLPNIEVKIAEDGEILCKGPNVMLGYYKNPEQTTEVMVGGFFHTGDVGELDKDGFLKITDRKKEIFKTSGGKYIIPQMIENLIKQSRFFEQGMVVGEGEKMPGAIIQPSFDFLREWAKRHSLDLSKSSNEEIVSNKKVRKRLEKEIHKINDKLGKWEQIKVFDFTLEEWSIDTGHLTPTLKLKRKIILNKYKDIYESFYGVK